ncbi:class I SAM-dependent DNA methyltransferase [Corynebacterium qintianiae]|uniref:HsdM family class I SAM-dependent methyltransferase n=1 Tax=Corynebacterium qintianiae TaxID=2709392 RepID=UPI0013EE2AA0|nr:N-6 DNA methylase [Corynebacterium qintianiae]
MTSPNEKTTDQFVRRILADIGVTAPYEQSISDAPIYLYDAMEGASKGTGGGRGKPEFVFESGDFIVVIEDKPDINFSVAYNDAEQLDLEYPARATHALNGAVHYARYFADRTRKRVFAVGVAGNEGLHDVTIAFVAPHAVPRLIDKLDNIADLGADKVDEYYKVKVLGELPREEREVREVRAVASQLHEAMRNYASLEGERKATLVSAILLALKYRPDLLCDLTGEQKNGYKDGEKVYKAAREYLESDLTDFMPKQKVGALLDQFSFIKSHVLLNKKNNNLGNVTPLHKFTETLKADILDAISEPGKSNFDVLGSFYGEFVKYGGSDGNALGIVLTPHHITELMAELIDVNADDIVIDPAAGTASFLIASMNRMYQDARNRYGGNPAVLEAKLEEIRKSRLYGVELQDKLFAIGTTNMILRGDGKANFQRHNFFDLDLHELRGDELDPISDQWIQGHGFTKVLINPPYSQSKNKETRHLSELSFVSRALDLLDVRGRLAAIVPQSAMVGKTKEDRYLKERIMRHHTLDAVITMNPDTFRGVGTHPVIALFIAGVPHPQHKQTAFINFKEDGYKIRPHVGLVGEGNQDSRRQQLLSVLNDGVAADSTFIVRSEVTAKDEWQHSYFYFNDQPPAYEDFLNTFADYLTWETDMHTHGYGHLITPVDDSADEA